jgi:hypothetical protein
VASGPDADVRVLPVTGGVPAWHCWTDGVRLVFARPRLLVYAWLLTIAASLPAALVVRQQIAEDLGRSALAEEVGNGVGYDWWQEFASRNAGLGDTLVPSIIGGAATVDNISSVADGQGEQMAVRGYLAVFAVAWVFLSGGMLRIYILRTDGRALLRHCAEAFPAVLLTTAVALVAYGAIFLLLHPWVFGTWLPGITQDLDVERTVFAWRLGGYAVIGLAAACVGILADFARLFAVDGRSHGVLQAWLAAVRFLRGHLAAVLMLYALHVVAFAGLACAWLLLAPGATNAGLASWAAFAGIQLFLLIRIALKLQACAAQTALVAARR